METGLTSLSKLFTERLFRIPDYQRGYAWGDKQLTDFWNDLIQLNSNKGHYAGVLTLEEVALEKYSNWDEDLWMIQKKSYKPYYVVDGQQRLTTAIILLQIITELMGDKNLNYDEKLDIKKKFLYANKEAGCEQTYIFGYEKDNPSYVYLKKKIFNTDCSERDLQTPTLYTANLSNAKKFFEVNLMPKKHEELEDIYQKLTQKFLFNIFTIENDVEVCVAFETMNNRGKPLSNLELLKNRLIYLSTKFEAEEGDKISLRRTINNCWKSVYHALGRNPSEPLSDDEFLDIHTELYFSKFLFNSGMFQYYRHIRNTSYILLSEIFTSRRITDDDEPLTPTDINNYSKSLQSSVELWSLIHDANDCPVAYPIKELLGKLKRITWQERYGKLLLYVFQTTEIDSRRKKFLEVFERFIFISSLTPERFYSDTAQVLKNTRVIIDELIVENAGVDKIIYTIEETLDSRIQDSDFIKSVREYFEKEGFYNWSKIRYFLYEYNSYLGNKSKSEHEKLDWDTLIKYDPFYIDYRHSERDFESVEHIFPCKANALYWKQRFVNLSKKNRISLRNSLGNLLPLSKPKNSSLGNKPFNEKKSKINGDPIGYSYGCYAENEVCKYEEWTPQTILARGLNLIDFMEKRWRISFGTNQEKIKMLGLEFIK